MEKKKEPVVDKSFVNSEILPLVTGTRLDNVISKTGRLSRKNRNRIGRLLIGDILEAFTANTGRLLSEKQQQEIGRLIEGQCMGLIKNKLKQQR